MALCSEVVPLCSHVYMCQPLCQLHILLRRSGEAAIPENLLHCDVDASLMHAFCVMTTVSLGFMSLYVMVLKLIQKRERKQALYCTFLWFDSNIFFDTTLPVCAAGRGRNERRDGGQRSELYGLLQRGQTPLR